MLRRLRTERILKKVQRGMK
ncbi:hypothetical protein Mgra_00008029 [Meloidogyne graminicola]|uniref:Uncharacterized protein n=1 Tax=Meloidogyne graminicola TaxID=189291 RepID=A0A8S9ZGY7_9BILA|nr:hypothetical protein Mgra_00008029 [Meloidogyne graminicola]